MLRKARCDDALIMPLSRVMPSASIARRFAFARLFRRDAASIIFADARYATYKRAYARASCCATRYKIIACYFRHAMPFSRYVADAVDVCQHYAAA